MIVAFTATLAGCGALAYAVAQLLFMFAVFMAAVALWIAIFWGMGKWFRNWRLYSRHRLAKRIRTFLRERRQARQAQA